MKMMNKAIDLITKSKKILVIQAENPDGDSLGSALALEEILTDIKKEVTLYCPVEIPKYMRYIKGWDRVVSDFNFQTDLIIIVDTTAEVLLSKTIEIPGVRHHLETKPILVIDHHTTDSKLSFKNTALIDSAVATAELVYDLAIKANWKISKAAAENLMIAIMSDSLGMTVQTVSPKTYFILGKLAELGANNHEAEQRRREYMKKSPEILSYKGRLLERISYFLDGRLAFVHIPWEEIQAYSDQYNPSVLVLDEIRLVEGVEVGIAVKTYPDGKLTGKIRSNLPVSEQIAGYFGGGGHDFAAGFRVYESLENIMPELLYVVDRVITEHQKDVTKNL
ncbi:MAG: DHH family phosphoesterase [Candidatus Saccharimonadales bacterium]